MRTFVLAVAIALALAAPASAAAQATARMPAVYKNCTNFNKKYPHGVGRVGARDKTKGERVTTFRRSPSLYRAAMRWNSDLDRDDDGIACEKA